MSIEQSKSLFVIQSLVAPKEVEDRDQRRSQFLCLPMFIRAEQIMGQIIACETLY